MDYTQIIKKYLVALLMILGAAMAITLIAWILVKVNDKGSSKRAPEQLELTDLKQNRLPEKFPSNIPLENNANITQNFNAVTPEGLFQATRAFVTAKSLEENLRIYTDYMDKNEWQIQNTINEPNLKMVQGNKGKARLQITIGESSSDPKVRTVTISYNEL